MKITFWRDIFNTRVWTNDANFYFLEEGIAEIAAKPSIGVVISGGGTRSATAGHGQLRGLWKKGFLPKIKYLSCNSGGTWVSVPFIYSNNDAGFFSDYYIPKECTFQNLDKIRKESFLDCVTHAGIIQQGIWEKIKTIKSIWGRVLQYDI